MLFPEEIEAKVAAPEPAKAEKAPPGAPCAAFAEFTAKREREREAAARAKLPGGQLPAQDWFKPDAKVPPEVVGPICHSAKEIDADVVLDSEPGFG